MIVYADTANNKDQLKYYLNSWYFKIILLSLLKMLTFYLDIKKP